MFQELIRTVRAGLSGRGERGHLARSALGTMTVSLVGTAVSFVVSVLLARVLGSAGYGTYAFAMSVTLLLTVPASVGLPQPLIRDVASLEASEKWGRLKGHVIRSDQITILGSVGVAFVAGPVIWLWPGVDSATRATLLWGLALLPLLSLERVHGAILRGFRSVIKGQIHGSIIRPFVLGLALLLAVILSTELTPADAMTAHVVSALIGVMVATFWVWRTAPDDVWNAEPTSTFRNVLLGATPFLGLQLLQVVNNQVDILVLGVLAPAGEVGIYRVAIAVATFTNFFLAAGSIVVQPELARLHGGGHRNEVQRLVTGHARMVGMATIPLAMLFVVAGRPFLRLVYGMEYLNAYTPLLLLVGGQLVNVATGPVAEVLNMTGHERETVRGLVLATVWAVIANLILIPVWGLLGAAVAHASSLALWNIYLAVRVSKVVGITSTAWGRARSR